MRSGCQTVVLGESDFCKGWRAARAFHLFGAKRSYCPAANGGFGAKRGFRRVGAQACDRARISLSSALVGGGVSRTSASILTSQLVASRTSASVWPGCTEST